MIFRKELNYLLRKSDFSFENLIFQEIIYLLRKYDFDVRKYECFHKNIKHLFRKYDLFIQEYAKATPLWDELTFFECFLGKQLTK